MKNRGTCDQKQCSRNESKSSLDPLTEDLSEGDLSNLNLGDQNITAEVFKKEFPKQ